MEPVETAAELAGRKEILDFLLAQASSKSLGSSYISGQKRVGKTSIVKTLKTRLQNLYPMDFWSSTLREVTTHTRMPR